MSDQSHNASAGAAIRHEPVAAQSAGAGRPSDAELDERERQKAQPRRHAGPPLGGAAPAAAPPHPHDPATATDPKE